MTIRAMLMAAAALALLSAPAAAQQSVPPAAASWLRCAALGALAERGAPDAMSKKASAAVHARYRDLFVAYMVALEGKKVDPRVVGTRVAGTIQSLIAERRGLNRTEQPILLACLKDLDRLTANVPETVRKMVAATPRPTQTTMHRDMWATCAVALQWSLESGLTSDPEARAAARRYHQLFQGAAKQQGLSDAEIENGLKELKAIAAKKSPNDLKSAITSCVREKP
ncbi:hypothetical protein [Rhodoligotrophos defluvii]|uniref:hypothetical protein n=1 Tax=Rhodoligotrophos defluvii TaxID=2561934 RepID=UPI0010CA10E2|nr:hypothetical protein [Rhodoligotrophos defluvii]